MRQLMLFALFMFPVSLIMFFVTFSLAWFCGIILSIVGTVVFGSLAIAGQYDD